MGTTPSPGGARWCSAHSCATPLAVAGEAGVLRCIVRGNVAATGSMVVRAVWSRARGPATSSDRSGCLGARAAGSRVINGPRRSLVEARAARQSPAGARAWRAEHRSRRCTSWPQLFIVEHLSAEARGATRGDRRAAPGPAARATAGATWPSLVAMSAPEWRRSVRRRGGAGHPGGRSCPRDPASTRSR